MSIIDTSSFTSGPAPDAFPISPMGVSPDARAWASRTVEKIRAAVVGGLRFLPRLDNYTAETPEIRAAYRLMLREPVLKSAHKTKVEAVAQLSWNVPPVDDQEERDIEVADFVKHCARKIRGRASGIARRVLGGALLDGFSVSNKVYRTEDRGRFAGKWVPRFLKAKDTEALTLSTDQYRNIIAVRPLWFGMGEAYDPADFVIYSYGSLFESALGTSDHRAAYGSFFFKDAIKKLWGLHLDKYVSPLLRGTYATADQKAALETALEDARANTWLTIPQGVLVEAVQLATRGEAEFEAACRYQDQQMLIATAGAYLQTLEGGTPDGRGNTEVHQSAAELFQWSLAEDLTTVINEQLVPEWVELNYQGADCPEVTLGSISDSEMRDSLAIDKGLQEMGHRHSRKDIAKRYNRAVATQPEDLLNPGGDPLAEPQSPALGADLAALGFGPAAGGQGGGEPPALPFNFAEGESYFATCDRDEQGQCLPGGGGDRPSGGKPNAPAQDAKGLLARGRALGQKVAAKLIAGLKAAGRAIDDELNNGPSLVAAGFRSRDPAMMLHGISRAINSSIVELHEEVFETAMAQHSFGGAHAVGVAGAKVAAQAHTLILRGAAAVFRKLIGQKAAAFAEMHGHGKPAHPIDRALLKAAAQHTLAALQSIYDEAGVDVELPNEDDMSDRLWARMGE